MIPVRHPKGPNPNPNFIPNPIPNPNPNDSALYKSTFTYLLTYSKILAMADRPHTTRDTVPVPKCIPIVEHAI